MGAIAELLPCLAVGVAAGLWVELMIRVLGYWHAVNVFVPVALCALVVVLIKK